YLAREDARTAGICGLGVQGRSQLLGLCEVRDIETVKAYDIVPAARKRFVDEMSKEVGVDIVAAASAAEAAEGSDIVITCTPSPKPFLTGEMLADGAHVSAIGADTSAKRELDTSVLTRADKLVVDFRPQAFVVGDFAVPLKEGAIKESDVYAELGEIVTGKKAGRTSDSEVTLFKATGLAIQDVGTAFKVYQLAKEQGIGREI
ncbi:MAG: ornithine cyclodeaminase family protein, partial [Candidatus Bathyarchaeia archaeon]